MTDLMTLEELVEKYGEEALLTIYEKGYIGEGWRFKEVGKKIEIEIFEPTASHGKQLNIYLDDNHG